MTKPPTFHIRGALGDNGVVFEFELLRAKKLVVIRAYRPDERPENPEPLTTISQSEALWLAQELAAAAAGKEIDYREGYATSNEKCGRCAKRPPKQGSGWCAQCLAEVDRQRKETSTTSKRRSR